MSQDIKKEKVKEKQLDLGLKEPLGNTLITAKGRISRNLRILEIKRFIRSPYSWFFLTLAISLVATQVYYLINKLDALPTVIPIYFSSIDLTQRLGNKIELLLFPILSSIIIVATTVTGYHLYNSHRELIAFSLLNMLISVSVLTLILLKIFAMYI